MEFIGSIIGIVDGKPFRAEEIPDRHSGKHFPITILLHVVGHDKWIMAPETLKVTAASKGYVLETKRLTESQPIEFDMISVEGDGGVVICKPKPFVLRLSKGDGFSVTYNLEVTISGPYASIRGTLSFSEVLYELREATSAVVGSLARKDAV